MGDFAKSLIEPYKYVDGEHFGERKHWLHDDYVKFIALSSRLIEKNESGILAFITNNGYLDNVTFRGMRQVLSQTFDRVDLINLHGATLEFDLNEPKSDKTVFDIRTGVSIIIARKLEKKSEKSCVQYHSLFGPREYKYDWLEKANIDQFGGKKVLPKSPYHLFKPYNEGSIENYAQGFSLGTLFTNNRTGIVTMGDSFIIAPSVTKLESNIQDFLLNDWQESELKNKYALGKNYAKWILSNKSEIGTSRGDIVPILKRPFDKQFTVFDNNLLWRWRKETMKHLANKDNIALIYKRGDIQPKAPPAFVSNEISESRYWTCSGMNGIEYVAPLYLYPDENDLDQTRRVNMDEKIRKAIEAAAMGLSEGAAPLPGPSTASIDSQDQSIGQGQPPPKPDEVAIFDYIYGVLHCPAYRETYAEFLKIDFPRVPYPPSLDVFWDVSGKGAELRKLHLMDGIDPGTQYPYRGEGDNSVATINAKSYKMGNDETGSVFINEHQYFEGVPRIAWEFYIGGYQPAQKWLKDRKGRELLFDDRMHYRKIIHILMETDRIMKTIDMPLGGKR